MGRRLYGLYCDSFEFMNHPRCVCDIRSNDGVVTLIKTDTIPLSSMSRRNSLDSIVDQENSLLLKVSILEKYHMRLVL